MDAKFPGGASQSSRAAAQRGAAGAGLEGGARGRGRLFRAVSHNHSGHCPTTQVPIFTAHLSWTLAVLGKRQRCVRMHVAGPYQRLKRTEPIAPVSTAAR